MTMLTTTEMIEGPSSAELRDAVRQRLTDAEELALHNYGCYDRERQRANRLEDALQAIVDWSADSGPLAKAELGGMLAFARKTIAENSK